MICRNSSHKGPNCELQLISEKRLTFQKLSPYERRENPWEPGVPHCATNVYVIWIIISNFRRFGPLPVRGGEGGGIFSLRNYLLTLMTDTTRGYQNSFMNRKKNEKKKKVKTADEKNRRSACKMLWEKKMKKKCVGWVFERCSVKYESKWTRGGGQWISQ